MSDRISLRRVFALGQRTDLRAFLKQPVYMKFLESKDILADSVYRTEEQNSTCFCKPPVFYFDI